MKSIIKKVFLLAILIMCAMTMFACKKSGELENEPPTTFKEARSYMTDNVAVILHFDTEGHYSFTDFLSSTDTNSFMNGSMRGGTYELYSNKVVLICGNIKMVLNIDGDDLVYDEPASKNIPNGMKAKYEAGEKKGERRYPNKSVWKLERFEESSSEQ